MEYEIAQLESYAKVM